MQRKSARAIDIEAADWVAALDAGPLSGERQREFEGWVTGDGRCRGAFERMRAIALATERARALGPDFEAEVFSAQALASRRRILQIGGGIAAAASVCAVLGREVMLNRHLYRTRLGENKVFAMDDGSVITLNTMSEIRVAFSEAERSVELLEGEALFEVAKNPARPFVVTAGDTHIRVVGTCFAVRKLDAAPLQVLVREGIVEVSKPQLVEARPVTILANTRAVTFSGKAPIATQRVAAGELNREMVWQDGRLAFEGQSLQQAAAEFARYSDIKIIIDDPALAREEIAGLFRANDPVGFAKTVAISLNARAIVSEAEVHLAR